MSRIEAVLVDFYGTISAGDRAAVERACARIVTACRLPLSAAELAVIWGERFFEAIEQSNHQHFRTLYECEVSSLEATLAEYGVAADPRPFVAELEAYWADPPLHADAVAFLQDIKLPICCVSNADSMPLAAAIARHALPFDAVVCSEAARCYKPQVAIFERAARQLGVAPQNLIHIGDSLHSDIGGASRLGITTVWVRREARIHDIGTSTPDHVVERLTEATALLLRR
ncbi:MAG: HAD family hydrolase [Planctomycetes bacterium]|nr:HAD family hydrolase [Planctomycetota bacterium]